MTDMIAYFMIFTFIVIPIMGLTFVGWELIRFYYENQSLLISSPF